MIINYVLVKDVCHRHLHLTRLSFVQFSEQSRAEAEDFVVVELIDPGYKMTYLPIRTTVRLCRQLI